nr:unnamed protein product [Callosobruchus analis]
MPFKSKFSPGSLNVSRTKTKSTKNGLLISCQNLEDLLTLKNDLQADIVNTYGNYEPPKQSSSDSKVELVDDFIDKPIFDNKLICTQRDLKICTVLKNEKYEVPIARGYVPWVGLDVDSKSSFRLSVVLNFVNMTILKRTAAVITIVQTPMRLKIATARLLVQIINFRTVVSKPIFL